MRIIKNCLLGLSIIIATVSCTTGTPKTVENKIAAIENKVVEAAPSINHSAFNQLLQKHVSANGMVSYTGFNKDKAKLQDYIKSLTSVNAASLSKNEQLAFWINAYNALTIDQILRNYPLKSIQNIAGGKVWDQNLPYQFNGKTLTLNTIEKKILLSGELFDARIHFAVNCAAVSCPTLINKAYTADNVQALLTQNTKAALANPAFNKISTAKASISTLFNWYKADFDKAEGSVINFINKYSTTKINSNTKIDYLDYNWSLNGK
jgi:GH24 family phage-related lysozyme (muramidase)